jgi:hypothetical protein
MEVIMKKYPNFPNVPVEEDTRLLRQKEIEIENIPVLIQKWAWEGIVAESAIFHSKDVSEIADADLFQKIVDNYQVGHDQRHTIKRNEDGYTFVNFNFITS